MEWIDVSCKGGSACDHSAGTPTVAQLLTEMDRLHIARALVHSAWSEAIGPEDANEQLFEDLVPHDRLHPVAEVLPEGGERFLDRPGDAIADLIARGAVAGLARCKKNTFLLIGWCAGDMLEVMQAARLPLMVCVEDIAPDHLYRLLQDFSDLPVILQEMPRTGYNRIVFPLLASFPRLHIVCDAPYSVHLGIDYLVNRFGPDQLLWGSRFPLSEGGAAITGLTYAGITDEDRAAIAGGNISRLMSEVRHG